MPATAPLRALLGFAAAAISVLTFHQAMWGVLHILALPGLEMPPPLPMRPVPPLGVPAILNLCFWGGLYGAVFGLLAPRLRGRLRLAGLGLGMVAVLVGYFVVAPLKGQPIAGGWELARWARSLLLNGSWGLGVGIILPLIAPRVVRVA
jgi:hypothetical protein